MNKVMNKVYNPGCALLIYKPDYAEKVMEFLSKEIDGISLHTICCHHDPKLPKGSQVINTCAGCDRRFSGDYEGITTVSLWEVLADSGFDFPDYKGMTMTVHDPCPIRGKRVVHEAVRTLLKKMNINIVEAAANRGNSVCCGDSFYPKLTIEKVHEKMQTRANSMPCEDVCVYCVSCIKSMKIGGKKPRYILDLLFGEPTDAGVYDTEKWHEQVSKFAEAH